MAIKAITQDILNRIASENKLEPSRIEHSSDKRIMFLLFKDLKGSSAHCQAVLSLPEGASGPVQAFCGIYEARKVVDDGTAEYVDVPQAIMQVSARFRRLQNSYLDRVSSV